MAVVHVIAGGPSAAGLDFSKLVGHGDIIGVNDSYFNAPCDAVVSIDGRWMRHRWERLRDANAKAWLRADSFAKHVGLNRVWPGLTLGACDVGGSGPGLGLHCLHGNNSGLVALHYAFHLGYDAYFLYGFDMGFSGPQKHWYSDYEWSAKGNQMYPAFMQQFVGIADILKSQGKQVYNVSPGSKLPFFERIDYAQAQDLFTGL